MCAAVVILLVHVLILCAILSLFIVGQVCVRSGLLFWKCCLCCVVVVVYVVLCCFASWIVRGCRCMWVPLVMLVVLDYC